MKRYAIVRVDNKCPLNVEDSFYCFEHLRKDKCKKCKEIRGDTKEQLVAKITQVMFRKEIKYWRKDYLDIPYKKCLEQAIEIVEFLGVE